MGNAKPTRSTWSTLGFLTLLVLSLLVSALVPAASSWAPFSRFDLDEILLRMR